MEALRQSGTNHLLYAPLVHGYFRFAAGLGIPQGFALAQSMNALWGGVGIGAYAYIVFRLAGRWWIALSCSTALGLSRAYSVHAVDMTEPMPAMALVVGMVESHFSGIGCGCPILSSTRIASGLRSR
jgi:hypothetical protein